MPVSHGSLRIAATGAWLVSLFSYVFGVGLALANRETGAADAELVVVAIQNLSFVAIATLGFLILRSQPENKVAWAILFAGIVFPLEAFFGELTVYALGTWGPVDITLYVGWVSRWMLITATLVVPLILLYYPDGKLPSPGWRPAVLSIGVFVGMTWFFLAFDPTPMDVGDLPNPFAIEALESGFFTAVAGVFFWGLAILPLVGAASLIPRYRRSRGVERQQMKLIAWVGAVAVVYFVVLDTFFQLTLVADAIVNTLFTLYVGAALTAGIVRYKLFEIDRIISRSISYAIVIAILGAVFAIGVLGIPNALGLADSPLLVAASTLAVAGLFNPLRKRIQGRVDRRFNRSSYQADRVAQEFATQLREPLTPPELANAWLETVDRHLEPTASALWLQPRLMDDSRP